MASDTIYLTDLSDTEWQVVRPLLPVPRSTHSRPRRHRLRTSFIAICYVLRTGCAWRLLPKDLPAWQTVYHYFRKWRLDGTWEPLHWTCPHDTMLLANSKGVLPARNSRYQQIADPGGKSVAV